jgi:CheY-like chemotaxis protein
MHQHANKGAWPMERHSSYKINSNVLTVEHSLKTRVTEVSQVVSSRINPTGYEKAKDMSRKVTPSILVVDDELDTVVVLERILKKRGYDIHIAFDGLEALGKLHSNHFDLVITDLLMPNLDGIQLLSRIRKEWPTLPVLVITAVDNEQTHRQVLSMGARAYLRKPFERKQLFYAITEIVQPFTMENVAISSTEDTVLPLVGAYG